MQSDNFLLVSITAEKFGCRPSRLVGLRDPVLALDFDLAAAARLLAAQRAASVEAEASFADSPPSPRRTREVYW